MFIPEYGGEAENLWKRQGARPWVGPNAGAEADFIPGRGLLSGARGLLLQARPDLLPPTCLVHSGGEWGGFSDMDRLTAFPDYKVPQVLRHLGVSGTAMSFPEGRFHHPPCGGVARRGRDPANTIRAVDSSARTAVAGERLEEL